MTETDDTTPVGNPARAAAPQTVRDREKDLAAAERRLARLVESPLRPVAKINQRIPAARKAVEQAKKTLTTAKTELKQVPVKVPANQLHPGRQRALPAIGRRTFQMVPRMLACDSGLWLADRLNNYLRDNNEYRTLTRGLFRLHGTLDYQPKKITVTLDPPGSPRLTRALALLIDEINHTPPHLPGDPRPITYHLAPTQQ